MKKARRSPSTLRERGMWTDLRRPNSEQLSWQSLTTQDVAVTASSNAATEAE